MSEKWDPLESIYDSSNEIIAASRKREIRNILKSYVGIYDPFCELIQNAMDAVDLRKKVVNEEGYIKKIIIKIDLQTNSFSVIDNGIGFKENEFKSFLSPNVSFKVKGNSRGNKGVGATYIAYGFNHIQMATKTPEYEGNFEMKDGRLWVDDQNFLVERPYVRSSSEIDDDFKSLDRGSLFTIKFGGENTRPKDLKWFSANTADQWKYILLIKTPLGNILNGNRKKDEILFDLNVTDKSGEITKLVNQKASYIYPHTAIKSSGNLKEILDYQQKLLASGKDASKLPTKYRQLNGIYTQWDDKELQGFFNNIGSNVEKFIDEYSINAYAYFCYTTQIWDEFNDNIAKLRRGQRILRGGLQLATDNMPQGELITIPLTSNIGYQNQTHIVIHFKNADPDLGRKGFQPELKEAAEKLAVAIVNKLKGWRKLLKKDSGTAPTILDEGKLHDWIKEQEDYEKNNPLLISNESFFLPVKEISITSIPVCEQDVVVLFNQLIAGGVIRGLKLMASSTHLQYDGLYRFFIQEPLDNHIFHKEENPLGVQDLVLKEEYASKPYVLEYKYNVDALIREFKNQEKHESDINIIVAWEVGEQWKERYEITSLLDLDNIHHRPFHGITHIFNDENSGEKRFYGIILSELIDYLNDIDGCQELQKERYGDII